MKNKCEHYHIADKIILWPPDEPPITIKTGSCWGTEERKECFCDGDRVNCTFYLGHSGETRKDITIEDAIKHFKHGISHDIFKEPVTRYARMAVEALEKQTPKKVKKEKYFTVFKGFGFITTCHCPSCNHPITEYENTNVYPQTRNDYCNVCGQALDWK